MPSAASKRSKATLPSAFEETPDQAADESTGLPFRTSKKKSRHASSNQIQLPEDTVEEEVAEGEPVSPVGPQSILGQLPPSFGRHGNAFSESLPPTEKVSDLFPTRTEDWSREVPYGKSPPGEPRPGFSVSESPPVQPGGIGRGGFSTRSPAVSPRQRYSRPVSYGGGPPPVPGLQTVTEPYPHPSSSYGSPPVPTHLPQPHFYAPQDIDLGVGAASGAPNSDISFIALTQLSLLVQGVSSQAVQAILIGSEERLDVLSLQSTRVELLGSLSGLPGTVINATILTWESGDDPFSQYRPLVATVLHGQKRSENEDEYAEQWEDDAPRSMARVPSTQVGIQASTEYQTRVEIYSLSKSLHIATLLTLPSVKAEPMYGGKYFVPPMPKGELRLSAAGNYLAVTSGSSGELFVFGISPQQSFECLAKFWTTIQPHTQRRDSSHSRTSDADVSPADFNRGANAESPILSISDRWLALSPAASPSRPSINADLGSAVLQSRLSGLDLSNAPPRPSLSCDVDSPDVDTFLGKFVRGVTQQAVKSAGWFIDQGVQAFNSYWRKDPSSSVAPRPSPGQQDPAARPLAGQFPPTHGVETQSSTREPDLVAIFDLKKLEQSSTKKHTEQPRPLATFQPPGGCSYLSFAPNGLSILTASRKGDLHYVWDLMQIRYHRIAAVVPTSTSGEALSTAPRVRQIAKFPRYTSSTVVDVVWEPAIGERFAVVTKNGTVHLYDMPPMAFRWPPPRRPKRPRPTSEPLDSAITTPGGDAPSSGGFLASAMNIANRSSPIFANWRGRTPSFSGGLGGISSAGAGLASATSAKGSRALAAGLSKSLGAASGTVTQMRLSGESRIHLKSLANNPSSGRIAWSVEQTRAVILILDKSACRRYTVIRTEPLEKNQPRTSVFDAGKVPGSKLPDLASLTKRTLAIRRSELGQSTREDESERFPGFWPSRKAEARSSSRRVVHPLSHAEIESNAPYQPFHSDPRVSLSVYADATQLGESQLPTVSTMFGPHHPTADPQVSGPLMFGTDLPALKLDLHIHQSQVDDNLEGRSVIYRETTGSPTNVEGAGEVMEQIVTTTRRRKTKRLEWGVETAGGPDEAGFFEDDCDVLDFAQDRV